MNLENKELKELFKLANKIGKKRYHKLTEEDFENYRAYDYWRYINGDGECGTTQESKDWVKNNSDWFCSICGDNYFDRGGRTIDHKLPRSQYPWLSINFENLWVICQYCNQEKGEKHWYEYEHHIFMNYPDLYLGVKLARPTKLLQSLCKEISY
ncbi:HNH endonuclease [Pleurocapsa sp. CCALA 161]|uniref:HNH endonuclease n=1 Tax=Pleurocapsa sp. CCALA 161 TaxID=2107688 RepID=UPI000D07C37C|nr:HNH endonuclease signature motif containing protein [Pleurocapsa sp. CCALA 161]PSB11024.1 HNH endonuclease [Pleurocapsa sp. CCALA 161]